MLENALIKELISIIRNGLVSAGSPYSSAVVQQGFQPTQQGVPSAPAVVITRFPSHRYGWVKREDEYDEYDNKFIHQEKQWYETTFQINALVTQNPALTTAMTAGDLANRVAAIMQSSSTLELLNSLGLGIYKISDVRAPFFIDDRDQNEQSPNFDFTITHKQVIISESPVVEAIEVNFNRV